MKRSRFSEEQIIGILKEHQAGLLANMARRRGERQFPTFPVCSRCVRWKLSG
jgi:hypothetical protein